MVNKDQAIGWIIFLVCAVVAIVYFVTLILPYEVTRLIGLNLATETELMYARIWLVAVPVLIAFIAILAIGAWIGWTMATTPPPRPIEEIESEVESEAKSEVESEAKSKGKAKKKSE